MAGLCAGVMLGCKETAVLNFTAIGISSLWWLFHLRRAKREPVRGVHAALPDDREEASNRHECRAPTAVPWVAIGAAFAAFFFLVILLYTWGGRHWQGPLDLLRSFPQFATRASGAGHAKPAWYYFALLGGGSAGWPALMLALVGSALIAKRMLRSCQGIIRSAESLVRKGAGPDSGGQDCPRSGFVDGMNREIALQLLLVYGITICAIYSLIPYKTPWLGLNLWLPLSILAGFGVSAAWHAARPALRPTLVLFACAIIAMLGRDTWERAFAKSADERNPYAYAHTGEDLLRLPERMDQLAREAGKSKSNFSIAVIAADPWPLPWYLRQFPKAGYWQPGQDPGGADVYITSLEAAERLAEKGWRSEFFGVRPEVLILLWAPPERKSP
jgi:hypothetical protein